MFGKTPQTRPSNAEAFNFLVRCQKKTEIPVAIQAGDGYDAELRPIKCESLDDLLEAIRGKLHVPQASVDCFEVLLATAIALRVHGLMLWMHCVGPSSSLKTTFAKIIASASDKTFMVSNFNGLYSGMRGSVDSSLVPLLHNKLLIIPDFTPLLTSSKDVQDKIFGEFRDIYDGAGRRIFGNGVDRNYQGVNFGVLTCVTDKIYQFGPGRSDLGERFLMSEINCSWGADGRQVHEKIETDVEGSAFERACLVGANGFAAGYDDSVKLDNLKAERAMCWGLLNHIVSWTDENRDRLAEFMQHVVHDQDFKKEVEAQAIWLETARCHRPQKDELFSRPALPHRTIGQLVKLAFGLCILNKTLEITPKIRNLIRKTVFDTCAGENLRMMNFLATEQHFSKELLADAIQRSPTHVANYADHLLRLGVITKTHRNNGTGNRGRNMLCYELSPQWRQLSETIGFKTMPAVPALRKRTLADITGKAQSLPMGLFKTMRERQNGNTPT